MHVTPIIDLWNGRPAAYILTDENGVPQSTDTPRELYMYVIEALKRDFSPIVVHRPTSLKAEKAWSKFKNDAPKPVWVYENGVIRDDSGNVVMGENSEDAELCWKREIDSKPALQTIMMAGVRYGSGNELMGPDELSVERQEMFSVAWGE